MVLILLIIVIIIPSVAFGMINIDYEDTGVEIYYFRHGSFQEGTECAQFFIDYQSATAYDYMAKVPALMKFDKYC